LCSFFCFFLWLLVVKTENPRLPGQSRVLEKFLF